MKRVLALQSINLVESDRDAVEMSVVSIGCSWLSFVC